MGRAGQAQSPLPSVPGASQGGNSGARTGCVCVQSRGIVRAGSPLRCHPWVTQGMGAVFVSPNPQQAEREQAQKRGQAPTGRAFRLAARLRLWWLRNPAGKTWLHECSMYIAADCHRVRTLEDGRVRTHPLPLCQCTAPRHYRVLLCTTAHYPGLLSGTPCLHVSLLSRALGHGPRHCARHCACQVRTSMQVLHTSTCCVVARGGHG